MILDDAGHDVGEDRRRGAAAPETPEGSQKPETAQTPESPDSSVTSESGADAPGGIDPRFDPVFQRGYRARPGEQPRTRLRPSTPASDATAASAVEERIVAPLPSRPPTVDSVVPSAEGGSVEPDPLDVFEVDRFDVGAALADVSLGAPAAGILDRAELSPRRNPYMLALWVMSGGFIVLGIVLYTITLYTSYSNNPTGEQDITMLVFSQLGWMLAAPLVTVGLITIVTLVLLTAIRARATTPDASPFVDPERND
ncbi:hypothetical protein [Leifsonia poae]|uniref:hypothetical protein n=1 Tax=Leifsonia poae TaxID=110933 RepID=UPI001CBF0832|nr:hypothetical protein [Leifsonia poae]